MKVNSKDKLMKKNKTSSKIEKVEEKKSKFKRPQKALLRNKTIIVGCGRLGASIANKVTKDGKNVLIVDHNKNAFELLDETFSGYTIVGDVTDMSTLENAYISSAKEIIITTGNDNVNIFLATVARDIYDVPNIYVRLDDPAMQDLLKDKNIKVILPFQLSFDYLDQIREAK